jgi:hypothetical protein
VKLTKNMLKQIIQEEVEAMQNVDDEEESSAEPEDPSGDRQDIGQDLLDLKGQLEGADGHTLEEVHSVLLDALGHLARAYGSEASKEHYNENY